MRGNDYANIPKNIVPLTLSSPVLYTILSAQDLCRTSR